MDKMLRWGKRLEVSCQHCKVLESIGFLPRCGFSFLASQFLFFLLFKTKGNTPKMFALGLLIGLGMNLLCALIAMLNGDICIAFSAFQPIIDILRTKLNQL